MDAFDKALAHVFGVEGGYSDDKNDRGGKTMLGITEAVARENGWTGAMSDMPRSFAAGIYRKKYWDSLRLDEVAKVSYLVALELFECGVNMGTTVAGRFLQRVLNALNANGKHYADIGVDGAVGPATLLALIGLFQKRGKPAEKVLLRLLNGQQAERYLVITDRNATQEDFMWGWTLQRVQGEFA